MSNQNYDHMCPYCDTVGRTVYEDLEAVFDGGKSVVQNAKCYACGKEWSDFFVMSERREKFAKLKSDDNKSACEKLADDLGIEILPGGNGGWKTIKFASGKQRKIQGWDAILKILNDIKNKKPATVADGWIAGAPEKAGDYVVRLRASGAAPERTRFGGMGSWPDDGQGAIWGLKVVSMAAIWPPEEIIAHLGPIPACRAVDTEVV